MLNTALLELLQTGYIDRLIDKYEPEAGVYYRVARPYNVENEVASRGGGGPSHK
jgi:hypothetical protein